MKLRIYFIFLICLIAFNAHSKELRNLNSPVRLDLRGANGFDGREGRDALPIDCSIFEAPINGINGEDGADGEKGDKGKDLYVYTNDNSKLSLITVNQSGGLGGLGGLGGEGSKGCNGGRPGKDGAKGERGKLGDFGKFYLLPSDFIIPKTNSIKILSLSELESESIILSENTWSENPGLKQLVSKRSVTNDSYYTFSKTTSYKVRLVWNSFQYLNTFFETRFALSLRDGKLELKSYTGGFLEYKIKSTPEGFDVIINKVIAEHRIQNLKLKRIKGSGIDLTLEVRQKFDPDVSVKTRFVISMALLDGREIADQTEFIEMPPSLVYKSIDSYFLSIGRLRIPSKFKQKNSKVKITLTVYREVQGQTRARGLEGIFKI